MKWGRRKLHPPPSPPSSSRPSLISHVFPMSWISKFKQKSATTSEQKPRKANYKGKWNSPTLMSSPKYACKDNGGGFYGLEDDDAYWRLSFREDGAEGKKDRGVSQSVWYDSDDGDEFQVPSSSCRNCRVNAVKVSEREEKQKLNGMHRCKKEKETGLRTPRSRNEKEWKLRKAKRGATEKKPEFRREQGKAEKGSTKCVEQDILEMEDFTGICRQEKEKFLPIDSDTKKKHHYVSPTDSRNPILNQPISEEQMSSNWKILKQQKMEEIKSRSEEHRKSLHISREFQRRKTKVNNKVRVYSPRTTSRVEICKIKALEDMKKAKLKMKKETKERTVQLKNGLDSCAVVKCSYDPQQDFRDSMIEMIMEKGINQPEELEELLACYLTLNSDEYHDLIIKVFRQVWFELNQSSYGTEFTE
ncbi:transcription repressor OFP5 [Ziziphus jujuba]|uniref:Transcription repressor n=2 Tax=Ziziphus jujuba TaxID=326968 RepID=A0A6P3ZJS1_ZIZJJ|nr:transcription repressor OFP5 [Ziziphus jujuba]KAH7545027.1 hypothetical protein FEM48_Zijuj01G0049900 [Ziziphus jujuba var. spinosa]